MSPKKKSDRKSSRKSGAGKRSRLKKPARARSSAVKKAAPAKRPAQMKSRSKPAPRKAAAARRARSRTDKTPGNRSRLVESVIAEQRGLGSAAAGQSGDLEGLSRVADADSESVEELLEEGQSFEAGVIRGVEHASDDEEHEVTTEEISEDDIPPEYGGSE